MLREKKSKTDYQAMAGIAAEHLWIYNHLYLGVWNTDSVI